MTARYTLTDADAKSFEQRLNGEGFPELAMMEAVASSIGRRLARTLKGNKTLKKIVVLAGPGNNGADGLAILRYLQTEAADLVLGRGLESIVIEWPGSPSPSRTLQAALVKRSPACDVEFFELPAAEKIILKRLNKSGGAALVIDAVFGAGFVPRSAPEWTAPFLKSFVAWAKKTSSLTVGVDVPSGLSPDGERAPEFADLNAQRTYAVAGPKRSQLDFDGVEASGRIFRVDLGLAPRREDIASAPVTEWIERDLSSLTASLTAKKITFPAVKLSAHKNSRGRVCVLGGSLAHGAATRLCAETSLRAGAGYATLVEPPGSDVKPKDLVKNDGEWVMRSAPKGEKAWGEILSEHDAFVFGCGLPSGGIPPGEWGEWKGFFSALHAALTSKSRLKCLVVDGGGLATFVSWWKESPRRTLQVPIVFTPHPGEAHDILKIFGTELPEKRVDTLLHLRSRLTGMGIKGAVLLKGAYPLVGALEADADILCFDVASSKLATAGSGDVLSGAIAGAALRVKTEEPSGTAFAALCAAVAAQSMCVKKLSESALASDISRAIGKNLGDLADALRA